MDRVWQAVENWFVTGAWVSIAGKAMVAALIVALGFAAARLVSLGLRRIRLHSHSAASLIYIVEKLAAYGLTVAGLFVGLSTLGVDLSSLTLFAGAVGVGAGLGLQGIVREFVSGLVVIFDPLVHVGDFVELEDGLRGEIIEVGPRATRLRTNDGLNVVIPNSKLIENQVVNWTLKGSSRRFHVPFSVAYGVDKAKVRDAVLEAARAVPFTSPDTDLRKAQVWLTGFGDSGLNFELVVWPTPDAVKRPSAMHAAYNWAIEDALRAADIEIPFTQIDLRLRSLFEREGDEALRTLNLATGDAEPEPERAARTRNDAAEDLMADAEREARERAAEEQAKRDAEAR
ncbi:MAG: mechanosensitive ion channel [Phenylobacterium sp.]|uniref:mechanosensitive ion channel family protein n=1 Tax=Phenylobacterium sp. TaxID=1871053 RepID=UPI0025E954B3|nr:mechanosensitive ion channel domain-containing protein [Phenylobacterium sp.]MBI1199245.1 mechanosensitive ion channel [Phenylobacterium sp.]